MDVSDEDLVAAALRGDADAFSALVARHYDTIYRFAFRMLGQKAEAEDLAQDVCAALAQKIGSWSGSGRFTTWLYRVARNLVTDRLRRRRGVGLDEIAEPVDDAPGAEARIVAEDRAKALDEALAHLPERQREAVVLRHLEGLANPEIAEILEVSVEAVESLVARGKRALAARLLGRKEELGLEG